jgi:hypothetical protein
MRIRLQAVAAVLLCCAGLGAVSARAQNTPGTSPYPTSLDTQTSLFVLTNNAVTTVSQPVGFGDTTITVASTGVFPTSGAITIAPAPGGPSEIVFYTGKTSTTFTGCLRGQDGTIALAHSITDLVVERVIAAHHNVLANSILPIEAKLGIGASTPALNQLLIGTGGGISIWSAPTPTQLNGWFGYTPANKAGDTFTGPIIAPTVNATTGFQVNGAAPSGHYLRGNGTNYVDSVILVGDLPTGIPNADLANSSIAVSNGGGLTVGGSPVALGGTLTLTLNVANANIWTALQTNVLSDAGTNTILTAQSMTHNTSGTPAAGFGVAERFGLQTTLTPDQSAVSLAAYWADPNDATRTSKFGISTVNQGGALTENLTVAGNGDLTLQGNTPVTGTMNIFVSNAVVQPALRYNGSLGQWQASDNGSSFYGLKPAPVKTPALPVSQGLPLPPCNAVRQTGCTRQ